MDIKYCNGSLLFSDDSQTLAQTLTNALTAGINLSGANLSGANLSNANLSGANLAGANLSNANLSGANLAGADLSDANLSDAYLSGAYLSGAYLSGANLSGANLSYAYLSYAYLSGANLSGANLRGANLSNANLSGANLRGANLSGANIEDVLGLHWQVCPARGSFYAYKMTAEGTVLELEIPADARRLTSLSSRKCRAEKARIVAAYNRNQERVQETEFTSIHNHDFKYRVGDLVMPDRYDPDPRIACSGGIHFFMTFPEAVDYQGNQQAKITVSGK